MAFAKHVFFAQVENFVLLDGCPCWEGGDREEKCKQMVMGLAKSRNLLEGLPEDKIKVGISSLKNSFEEERFSSNLNIITFAAI